jgi:hypothetical protein
MRKFNGKAQHTSDEYVLGCVKAKIYRGLLFEKCLQRVSDSYPHEIVIGVSALFVYFAYVCVQ